METKDVDRQQEELVAAFQGMCPEAREVMLQLARKYAVEFPAKKMARRPNLRLVAKRNGF